MRHHHRLCLDTPGLVPIHDSVVKKMLPQVRSWWAAWQAAFADDEASLFAAIAETPGAPADVPLLRRLDVALWMWGKQGRTARLA